MTTSLSRRRYLRAARVYAGDGRSPIADGVVALEGPSVAYVGSAKEIQAELAAAGDKIVDYGDATILPGLVDAHCHITLTGDGKTYEQQISDPDEMMSLIAVANLRRHLTQGVTTIRDNGGRNRVVFIVREAINRGYIHGPRMLLSGRPLTHSYGHFYWANGVADSESEIRAAVRQLVAEGADHIKIMASGGATAGNQPHYPSYTAEEMRTAVETAHGLGRLTTAHCRATASIVNAVEAGLDCVEHASFQVPAPIKHLGTGVAPTGNMVYDREVTERLQKAGTYVSFTIQTGGYETLLRLNRDAEQRDLTQEEKAQVAEIEAHFDMKLGIFSSLIADEVTPRLSISSDAGPFDVSFGALQHGMELAVRGGMTPQQAIDATTRIPAETCGILDQVGTLESGKKADVLAVAGNPLGDITRMWNPLAVYQGGRLVAPLVAESQVDQEPFAPQATPATPAIDC